MAKAGQGDKGNAWQMCDATEATRDEGVGTRGHVNGKEAKGQQMKKKKRKRLNSATRAMRQSRRDRAKAMRGEVATRERVQHVATRG